MMSRDTINSVVRSASRTLLRECVMRHDRDLMREMAEEWSAEKRANKGTRIARLVDVAGSKADVAAILGCAESTVHRMEVTPAKSGNSPKLVKYMGSVYNAMLNMMHDYGNGSDLEWARKAKPAKKPAKKKVKVREESFKANGAGTFEVNVKCEHCDGKGFVHRKFTVEELAALAGIERWGK